METNCTDCNQKSACASGGCNLYAAPFGNIHVRTPLLWPEAGTACTKQCKPRRDGRPKLCGIATMMPFPDAVC